MLDFTQIAEITDAATHLYHHYRGQNHFTALLADGRATQEEVDEYIEFFNA